MVTKPLEPGYKFTNIGRQPKYGVNDYPVVGRWSERRTPVLCHSGWHIPLKERLSNWINAELWEVRVKGQHVSDSTKQAWEQIRFVRKIEAWNMDGMTEFIKFCRPDNWQRYIYRDAYVAYDAVAAAYAAFAAAYDATYAAGDAAALLSQSNWIIANIINANGGTSNGS
jgi:hypothetical protein